MSFRHLQRKAKAAAAAAAAAASATSRDGGLMKAIQSELAHELSSSPSPPPHLDSVLSQDGARFKVDWDDSHTQDLLLKRRKGIEQISVWALMRSVRFEEEVSESNSSPTPLPGDVVMKVFVKKIGSDPVLHFDCKVSDDGFRIRSAYYHRSSEDMGANKYKGPQFSGLDPNLREALKEYLIARGIDDQLTSFLLQYLLKKEHYQYVNWLRSLEALLAMDG